MKPFMFLDVDGTVLVELESQANRFATVERVITRPGTQKVVSGFIINESDRSFTVEDHIMWREEVALFLQEISSQVNIVWLTGWKNNSHIIAEKFGIPFTEWLDWEVTFSEGGKIDAINAFMVNHPGVPFIWADDVAMVRNPEQVKTLPEPYLLIEPNSGLALSDAQMEEIRVFVKKTRGTVL